MLQDVLWWGLYQFEPLLVGSWLRRKALEECMRHIHYEVRAGIPQHYLYYWANSIIRAVWYGSSCLKAICHTLQQCGKCRSAEGLHVGLLLAADCLPVL
jgi:hypothetical protein